MNKSLENVPSQVDNLQDPSLMGLILFPEKITTSDLEPIVPDIDGTTYILQCNVRDDRDLESSDIGALKPEAALGEQQNAEQYFESIFDQMKASGEDLSSVQILVMASNATLRTHVGLTSKHRRGYETAEQALVGVREAMAKSGIAEEQLINNISSADKGPFEMSTMKDLEIMEEGKRNEGFVKEMMARFGEKADAYGQGNRFWIEYENDSPEVMELRKKYGVEGPDEISERVGGYLNSLEYNARQYHELNPGKRLIVWTVSHYDSISPYVKRGIFHIDKTMGLGVDKGAGIVINSRPTGEATTRIAGQEFPVRLVA
jgi:hypothetical protein